MIGTRTSRSPARAALAGALAMLSACQTPESRPRFATMSQTQREEARKQWDRLRGEARVQIAERHFAAGRLDAAAQELELAVSMAPDDPAVHLLAARVRLEQGLLAEARSSIQTAARYSADPEINYLAGIIAERYDDPTTALAEYASAVEKAPLDADYVLALAETLTALERPVDALELLQARMKDFERHAAIRVLAARIEWNLGLRGPALEHLREASRLDEQDAALAADLGMHLVQAGAFDEAIEVLRPLVMTTPTGSKGAADAPPAGARLGLIQAYLAVRRGTDARAVLGAMRPDMPDYAAAWTLLAATQAAAGDLEGAAASLSRANEGRTAPPETALLSAYVALRSGDFDAAERAARRALESAPSMSTAYCLLGRSMEARGRVLEACVAYGQAQSAESENRLAGHLLEALEARGTGASASDSSRQGSLWEHDDRARSAAGIQTNEQP